MHLISIVRCKKGYSSRSQTVGTFGTASHMRSPRCMPWPQTKSAFGILIRTRFLTACSWYNVQIVRGAISNGREWAFILLRLNENGKGGTYEVSPPTAIAFGSDYPNHVTNCGPDIVAGVLAHWVRRHRSLSVGCIHKRSTGRALLR